MGLGLWCPCHCTSQPEVPPEVEIPAPLIGQLVEWDLQTPANALIEHDPLIGKDQAQADNFMRMWDDWPFPGASTAWTRRAWAMDLSQITESVVNLSIEMTGVAAPQIGGNWYPPDAMEVYYMVGAMAAPYDRANLVGPFPWNPLAGVNFGEPQLIVSGIDDVVNAGLADAGYVGFLYLVWKPLTIWKSFDHASVPPFGWELGIDGTIRYTPN